MNIHAGCRRCCGSHPSKSRMYFRGSTKADVAGKGMRTLGAAATAKHVHSNLRSEWMGEDRDRITHHSHK